MRRFALALICALAPGVLHADAPAGLLAASSVDRPAMWVADRVTYTVELTCPRGFDVLLEDLGRDRLKLSGLDVLDSTIVRHDDADATRYVVRYVLTSYTLDAPLLSVDPFPVRYYAARAGERPEAAAPAGTVVVPGASVAFRSLLLDDQPAEVRDGRTVAERWWPYRILAPAGLALVVLAAVPFAFMIGAVARRARARPEATRPSPRQVRQAGRAALEELQGIDASSTETRRAAFARLDAAVRRHVADACGVAAMALTPDELARALERCEAPPPVEGVSAIVESCERARYAAPVDQPTEQDWKTALEKAGELLAGRR